MYQGHLKDIKEKTASLCLLVILAMTSLPGCKNSPAPAGGKRIPDLPMTDPFENSFAWEVSQKPAIESIYYYADAPHKHRRK
ncbi:MAG: hypothetical protein JXB00_07750 [Bacteroidales bacterium]|nr:hypothetical protein [Bacteroidales bacterium]